MNDNDSWIKEKFIQSLIPQNFENPSQEEIKQTTILAGAMKALISEAWLEAVAIAKEYVASGKPVFAKVENVQAVSLDDPPEKLFAMLKELADQRFNARTKHGNNWLR